MQASSRAPSRRTADAVASTGPGFWTDKWLVGEGAVPIALPVAIGLSMLLAFLASGWWTGELARAQSRDDGLWSLREVRLALLVSMQAAYLPMARAYVAQSAARVRDALQPWLDTDESERAAFLALDRRLARRAGFLGLAFAPLTALVVDRDPALYLRAEYWNAVVALTWVSSIWVTWWLGTFFYVSLAYARRFSELAEQLRPIDLLDLTGLAPFARFGLSSALLWLLLLSIITLNVVDLAWFAVAGTLAVLGGVTALVLPVLGVHHRLREAKQRELRRVDAALRGEDARLRGSPVAARAGELSLADLLAWRATVEALREWPFDTLTIVRFALYLGIPLGSWLGGAFVERLLGAALD